MAILAAALFAAAVRAEFYKCVDAQGRTSYQDEPCATGKGDIVLRKRETTPVRPVDPRTYNEVLDALDHGTHGQRFEAVDRYKEWHRLCNSDGNPACPLTDSQFRRLADYYYSRHLRWIEREAEDARLQELAKSARRERQEGLHIGMSAADVSASDAWGRPESVNKTTMRGLVLEQWIYRSRSGRSIYLTFENGRLTAIQD